MNCTLTDDQRQFEWEAVKEEEINNFNNLLERTTIHA